MQLINITTTDGKPSVNARDLHAFLEVGKDFSNWIKDRISAYDFTEGEDFSIESRSPKSASGNRGASKEYHISIDMAKELAMVERNEKGKEARAYFIACEKELKQPLALRDPMEMLADPAIMRGLLLGYTEKVLALETTVSELAPKGEAFDRIAGADGLTNITQAAKLLQMRPKELFDWLHANDWIYRRGGPWIAYEAKIKQGLMYCKFTTITRVDGSDKTCIQTLLTTKGIAKLSQKFNSEAA